MLDCATEDMTAWGDEEAAVLDCAAAEAPDMTPIELRMEVRGISKALDVAVTGGTDIFAVTVTVSVTVTTTGAAQDVARIAGADVAAMVLLAVAVLFHDNLVDATIRVDVFVVVALADKVADAALLDNTAVDLRVLDAALLVILAVELRAVVAAAVELASFVVVLRALDVAATVWLLGSRKVILGASVGATSLTLLVVTAAAVELSAFPVAVAFDAAIAVIV